MTLSTKKLSFIKYIFIFCLIIFNFIFFKSEIFASEEPNIYSNYAIVVDANSGNILYSKGAFEKVYPASTTKILTAILTIENCNLEEPFVVSSEALESIPYDSSVMGLEVGEIYKIKDLLYGLMLSSGNDAANVLGEAVSGDISSFVELMNNKAKEIGCLNTHFTNTHGYHNDNHYTTPYDMVKIMLYCLKNETFRQFIETKEYELPKTNKSEEPRTIVNTDRLFNPKYEDEYYEYAIGGKTGYTLEARGCLISYAKKDDKFFICATYDGSQNISGEQARYLDSKTLYEYAFNNFNNKDLIKKDTTYIVEDKENFLEYTVALNDNISFITTSEEIPENNYTLDVNIENLKDKKSNDIVGKVNYTFKEKYTDINTTSDVKLVSKKLDIENINDLMSYIIYLIKKYIIIVIIILLIIILLIIMNFKKYKKKKRKRYKDIFR